MWIHPLLEEFKGRRGLIVHIRGSVSMCVDRGCLIVRVGSRGCVSKGYLCGKGYFCGKSCLCW